MLRAEDVLQLCERYPELQVRLLVRWTRLVSSHCNFETPDMCQDRLGTNIGTTEKKSFLQAFTRAGIHHKSSAAASCRCDTD